jgi:hypothetical protein
MKCIIMFSGWNEAESRNNAEKSICFDKLSDLFDKQTNNFMISRNV